MRKQFAIWLAALVLGLVPLLAFPLMESASADNSQLYVAPGGNGAPANPELAGPTPITNTIYLPLVGKPPAGIQGRVTLNGAPAAGVPLDLRFFDGSNYSTIGSVATTAAGSFIFTNVPTLGPGQSYYVRFLNNPQTPGWLWVWGAADINNYATGTTLDVGSFDLADVALVAPPDNTLLSLPVQFQWTPRPATPTDSYQLAVYDYNDGDPSGSTAPLGYVNGVLLTGLNGGFQSNVPYAWEVWVNSPDGGFGVSLGTRIVGFTNVSSPASMTEAGPTSPAIGPVLRRRDLPTR